MALEGFYFTKDHEWAKIEGGVVVMGITDFAQQQLGEITFIELPAVGRQITPKAQVAAVESAKAASDVFAPLPGNITAVNETLQTQPELINQDCYEKGWICKIKPENIDALQTLMNAREYEDYLKGL